ncbi:hypothetical protein HPB52_013173 [Rhipicephalus sanguineus]|uniref:Regulatory protein zeste n=1 Tax=Rhipicephalus sanguineus TaxID=34632 RepID=A0A9D4SNX5_RHISA|nr:hypothetical protein HPB52_013173 [Rhipicephalus sanguineus]
MRDGGKTTAPRFVYTAEERELLRNLVMRHRSVIENKRTDNVSKRAKDIGWEKITEEYNSQPGIRRVTVSKLRKLWDNEKTKWKKMQSEQRRNLYATGGGPSTCRPMSPSLALVGAAASHMATRLPNPYDSDGAHIGQPVLSLPPARIFESMVTGSEDTMEELLDMSFEPILPATEGAASAVLHASPPSMTDPPASSTVPAEGSNVPRTALTAAPQGSGNALAGADAHLPSRSARSRTAAVERVLAPEVAARMEAIKNDERRKAELHAVELRLRRQQLSQQRQLHSMRMKQEQELHKIQVRLLEQQLEQQKSRFEMECQKQQQHAEK